MDNEDTLRAKTVEQLHVEISHQYVEIERAAAMEMKAREIRRVAAENIARRRQIIAEQEGK